MNADVFNLSKKRLKANLHTHTNISDGKFTPQAVIDIYQKKGYDVIALTDHHKTNQASKLRGDGITIISGIEMHPTTERGIMLHLLGLDIPENFEDKSGLHHQACIDHIVEAGGMCVLAHPYWTGMNSADILRLKNISAIEVFNTSTRYIGKQFNMTHWDEILDEGWRIPAIAVDDTHRKCDFFQGWTVICADDNTPKSIMSALKNGFFYSSMGPEFHKLEWDAATRTLHAECSPATEIIVLSAKSSGTCVNAPGVDARIDDSGNIEFKSEERTSFSVRLSKNIKYARCQIKDSTGRMAWTNPVYL